MANVKFKLLIVVMDDGKMAVQGPLHDKMLCYGLLGAAQDVVRDHKPEPPSSIVGVPLGTRVLPR